MKRETLQRRTSEGQRRIEQAKDAERAAAEVQRQENITFLNGKIKPEIKRLKAELAAAADLGHTTLSFKITYTDESILLKAVMDYCKKNKLTHKDIHDSGQVRYSDDSALQDYYDQYVEITWA